MLSDALTTDGVIYCIPKSAKQVLAIDPWGDFFETTKANMEHHPETFGFLFQKIIEVGDPSEPKSYFSIIVRGCGTEAGISSGHQYYVYTSNIMNEYGLIA